MMTPSLLLNSSATRYQTAISKFLKHWDINRQCRYCHSLSQIKQLIEQQMDIDRVVPIPRPSEVMKL
jgi:hypothetical protein